MKTKLTTILGVLLGLALLASACGGSDGGNASEADQDLIDAVAQQLSSEDDVPPGVDTDCMAAAMVTGLGGAEAIEQEYGLTLEDARAGNSDALDAVALSADDARNLASGMLDCGLGEAVLQGMTGGGMGEDDARCLFENLDQDIIRDLMATEFMNVEAAAEIAESAQDELFSGLLGAIGECEIDPSSLGL